MLNFVWFAVGAGVLLVALALTAVLLRLRRTLSVLEEVLLTANEEIRETLPEVRGSLGNVNDITTGVNLALRSGSQTASRSRRGLSAGLYGVGVGLRSYITTVGKGDQSSGQ